MGAQPARRRAAAPQGVPLRSRYETASRAVSRDVGLSVALPDGHELWLFGDTAVFQHPHTGSWKETHFIDGSSALEANYHRGSVPHGDDYPAGVPAQFIPAPTHVYLPDGTGRACTYRSDASYPARWPIGAAVMAPNSSQVWVSYTDVCVSRATVGGDIHSRVEGWGYLQYNWRTHHLDRGPVDISPPRPNGAALADSRVLGSPSFHDDRLTLFSSHCTSLRLACEGGDVWTVTVPATPTAYRSLRSRTLTRLAVHASARWSPITVSVGNYGDAYRLIELTSVGGDYRIYTAPHPTGPWTMRTTGSLPGCHHPRTGFCYALVGHPELSTTSRMFVSYMQPDSGPGGHLVISAVPN